MTAPRIFISMGFPYSNNLERFRNALETFLHDQCEVNPRIMGKNEYPDGNPLPKIRSVMPSCNGVIVVAFERKFVRSGLEKRGSNGEKRLTDRRYTTPWNHIESAMAYSIRLPIYILCQRGLSEEGLIESKFDWVVQYVDMESTDFEKPEVTQSLRNWVKERVIPHSRVPRLIRSLQGKIKVSELTARDIVATVAVLATSFSAGIATAGFLPLFKSGFLPLLK